MLYEPDLKDDALAAAIASTRRRRARRPSTEGDRADARRRAPRRSSSAPAPATTPSTSPPPRTRGIYVSNCPGKNAIAVAELAFGADPRARPPRFPTTSPSCAPGRWNKKEYSKARGLLRPDAGAARLRQHRPGNGAAGARVRHAGRRLEPALRAATAPTALRARCPAICDVTVAAVAGGRGRAQRRPQRSPRADARHEGPGQRGAPGPAQARLVRSSTPRAARSSTTRRSPRRCRTRGLRVALDVFAERAGGRDRRLHRPDRRAAGRLRHASHRRLDRSGAGGDCRGNRARHPHLQGDRQGAERREPATQTPATHMLVVRHRDRPGVLAHVFDHLRTGGPQRAGNRERDLRGRRSGRRADQPRRPAAAGAADGDRRGATPTSSACR